MLLTTFAELGCHAAHHLLWNPQPTARSNLSDQRVNPVGLDAILNGFAGGVFVRGASAVAQKESYDFRLFFLRSRGAAAAAAGILNCQMQWRRTALVPPDGVSPVCEERPNSGGATCSHGAMQGRHATLALEFGSAPALIKNSTTAY